MAEDFSGFSNQQVKNAALIKDSMAEINNLTKLYNKELGRAEEIIADVNTEYRGIKASADQVKNIQEQASKSSAATAKAIEQQQKQLNIVARLNARIDRLFESAKKSTGDTRENLDEFTGAILDYLEDRNLYQSMKPETRLGKMISETTEAYWEYLKKAEGKIIIDQETYDFAEAVVEKITSNAVVMDTMGFFGDEMNGVSCMTEVELLMEASISEYPFGFRGFVDNLVIDKETKTIRINDLKKTSKTVSSFSDTIEYFNYWAQAALYTVLVEDAFLSLPAYDGWTTEFRFIVVDSQMQIAPIKVSHETMRQWKEKLTDALLEASYHFEKRNFELPYKFLTDKELVI